MVLQRDSGLLAVVCDDMFIRIIDIETGRIVRELSCGVHGRILDIVCFVFLRWISGYINVSNRRFRQIRAG